MPNYDISNLPSPVQDALLQLTQQLVETWASAPLVPVALPGPCHVPDLSAGAALTPSPAGSEGQNALHQAFPRSAVELRILDMLRTLYPLSVTTYQLASVLGKPRGETRELCHALYTLGVIDHTTWGHYRHRPS